MQSAKEMPALMRQLHAMPFDCLNGERIDFEPYEEFLSVEDTQNWFRAWTGNVNADASGYLIFGQDGTGGYAAVWLVREQPELLAQPIVFFGSEGDLGVIARNFSEYLWLLAGGHGPFEAVSLPNDGKTPDAEFSKFARQNSTASQSKPSEVIARARAEFPEFEEYILSLCK